MNLPLDLPLNLPLNFITATKEFCSFEKFVPAPYIRKSFTLAEKAEKSDLVICGLGFYELFINGKRITKGYLAPYISNPDDVLFYDQYEIHELLDIGENVIGVILGNGMQNAFGGTVWDFNTARWRSAPKLSLLLEIKTASGAGKGEKTLTITSDESFKTAPSPIYMDDLRCGEFYDANKEIKNWNMPGFDDTAWNNAIIAEDIPRGEQVVCKAESIVAAYELKPVSVTRSSITSNGTPHKKLIGQGSQGKIVLPEDEYCTEGWLYDFGVNIAGLCRLKIKASKGQKVILQFGETLKDGGLDLSSMNFEPEGFNHRDIYICKGGGDEEVYMPSFTYHGFRYCLCIGITEEQAVPELLTCVVMNSGLKQRGGFDCSDETANLIYKAAIRSDLANFYYFPTDCPHREKNGWTGDAAVSAEQMLVSLTAENSMREWLRCIRKAQDNRGALPGIVPTSGWGFTWGNGPAWDAALTYLPYYIWLYRGDREVLAENAASILRYINYIFTRIDSDGLIRIGLGDWCPVGRRASDYKSPLEFTDTVISMDICMKASEIFDALGMEPQAALARSLHSILRTAARQKLIDLNTMEAAGNCQTSQAMAIYYDVFEPAEKQQAFAVLLKIIEQCEGHFDCGMLGMRVIFHVLSDFNESGLAYKMITRTDYPSYGNWIAQGATTLWESFKPEGEKCGSRNHHFFGDISSWFIRCITGIQLNPYKNNVEEVNIRPSFIQDLKYASGYHTAPAGDIKVSWRREEDASIELDIIIPQSMTGRIILESGCEFVDGCAVKAAITGKYKVVINNCRNSSV
ncbi:MAG: family 78 glycoside hydrolase catalytic domain [Eubacteriales bacterium]|nr:family 78 glycoside hydrolase catalytic domain [Eubacteriales bacterium]